MQGKSITTGLLINRKQILVVSLILLAITRQTFCLFPPKLKPTHHAKIRLSFEGSPLREIVDLALFGKECPKTVANFIALCTGSHINPKYNKRMSLWGTKVIYVKPSNYVIFGDVITDNGAS
jgi:hypothetical protein